MDNPEKKEKKSKKSKSESREKSSKRKDSKSRKHHSKEKDEGAGMSFGDDRNHLDTGLKMKKQSDKRTKHKGPDEFESVENISNSQTRDIT